MNTIPSANPPSPRRIARRYFLNCPGHGLHGERVKPAGYDDRALCKRNRWIVASRVGVFEVPTAQIRMESPR